MRRSAAVLTCMVVLTVACDAGAPPWSEPAPGPSPLAEASTESRPGGVPDDAEPASVDRVVDGDTLRVRVELPGGSIPPTDSERVRLLSIDAPELDRPDVGEQCGAAAAAERLEELVPPGTPVWLAADVEDRDRHGRALRQVWTAEGTDVSAALVAEGLARAVLYRPNDRFHAHLARLDAEARAAAVGVWGELCNLPPWAGSPGAGLPPDGVSRAGSVHAG